MQSFDCVRSVIKKPLAAPSNLKVSAPASGSEINLTWDNVEADYYSIYRRGGSSTVFECIGNTDRITTSYTDRNVFVSETYCYYVQANDYMTYVNSIDNPNSDTSCIELTVSDETLIADKTPPSAPSNLEIFVDDSNSRITLRWDQTFDNIEKIKGYKIYRRHGSGTAFEWIQSYGYCGNYDPDKDSYYHCSYEDIIPSDDEIPFDYCYYVSAVDAAGNESAPSNISYTVTSNFKTAVLSSEIYLKWNAASTANTVVGGYRIYRNGSLYATVQANTGSFKDTSSVEPSTIYHYKVSAVDTSGNELKYSETYARTPGTETLKLNDTGITRWGNETDNTLTSSQPDYPGQDADYGRDKTHNDDSDGHAGFGFTKIGANGEVLPVVAAEWSAVLDNVTGLMWENKTNDAGLHKNYNKYTWYEPDNRINGGDAGSQNGGTCPEGNCDTWHFIQSVNVERLCGYNDWRMPTQKELQGIVDYECTSPAMDARFFANLPINPKYWSSSPSTYYSDRYPYNDSTAAAWYIDFFNGQNIGELKNKPHYVRVVRGGQ